MAYRMSNGRSGGCGARLLIGVLLALGAIASYYLGTEKFLNPVTGRVQRVALSPKEEIALGLNSAPEMARQFGGLYPDQQAQNLITGIGKRLVGANTEINQSPYYFQFHLLADPQTVNAFALPGGQVFITVGLLKLLKSEDEVAGVLGHEVGHVVGRHSNEQMAKAQLSQGLVNAVVMAGGSDYGMTAGQIAQFVSQMKNTAYGRGDELEADKLGVRFMKRAGYDPHALIRVMEVLKQSADGRAPPEFLSTHPDPENRIERIKEAIREIETGGS
jgi:predicted Zn-dependent protease